MGVTFERGSEPIRLVIWDLDETFWLGTLTEGGIRYQQHVHDAVIALARRGILSSICSKNDFAPVRDLLVERGIWEYFVFPSISWEPKGPRIAQLVDAVQLRPATILFLDDNPMNLHEALHFVPGLQVADETTVSGLLDDPLLRGKDDQGLSRLKQYKLLEQRRADEVRSGGDTSEFLRSSNIRVTILHDVSDHLDRVVELINRTNQLNFTKVRLPEDIEAARTELSAQLSGFRWQVGLVRVVDNYGDYGFVGFYAFDVLRRRLDHFCFSCRTLGMGVESWLYARLGRPHITIQGEVLTDLRAADAPEIDWIHLADPETKEATAKPTRFGGVYLRGSCDLAAIGHYVGLVSREVTTEFNIGFGGMNLRLDHSMFIRHAIQGVTPAEAEALASIGYAAEVLKSALPVMTRNGDLFIFSFQTDTNFPLYRHKLSGVLAPFNVPGVQPIKDATLLGGRVDEVMGTRKGRLALRALCEHFEYVGLTTEADYKANVRLALDLIPASTPVSVILGLEPAWAQKPNNTRTSARTVFNGWTRDLAAQYKNVSFLDLRSCIQDSKEIYDLAHLDRRVYLRAFEKIVQMADTPQGDAEKAVA